MRIAEATRVGAMLLAMALLGSWVPGQEVVRVPSVLPMPAGTAVLEPSVSEDGRVDLRTLVRDFTRSGSWSLSIDEETEFALERADLFLVGVLSAEPELAPFTFEHLLASAGFALDAVWDDELRVLGVAPRGRVGASPRALHVDELEAWAQHPAFEVEVEIQSNELHRHFLAMLLRSWLGPENRAEAERRPVERVVLTGDAHSVAAAGALVSEMHARLSDDLPQTAPLPTPPIAARGLTLLPDADLLSVLEEYARATDQVFAMDEDTRLWLAYEHSTWRSAVDVLARDLPLVFESWLADQGYALVELSAAAPRLARVERLGEPFRKAVLCNARLLSAGQLEFVAERAATWYVTVFRFESLDVRGLEQRLARTQASILTEGHDDSGLLIAAGTGRDLAHLAGVLASLERAAGER